MMFYILARLKVSVNIILNNMGERKYYSEKILSKSEIEKAPNVALFYKAICENCGCVFETRLFNKSFICKKCKCSLSQKSLYKNNPNLAKERLIKRTQYNLEHYGVENPYQRQDVKDKIKKTNIERYGVDNPSKSNEIKNKVKETCLKKFGTEYSFQSDEVRAKAKSTIIKKYGVLHPMQNDEIKNKAMLKNRENRKIAIEKARQTCLDKYGVIHPMQDQNVQNSTKKKFTYKGFNFDSSWELAFFIFNEDSHRNIKRCSKSFNYYFNNKKHTYTPDFEIDGKLYEIKGLQFFENKNPNGKMINPYDRSQDALFEAKYQCALKNNVIFITDCEFYIRYVNDNYTKDFLNLFYNNIPFPYPNQDLKDSSDDGIIRHFHKSIYDASRKGQKSPILAWTDKNLILKSALNRLKYVKRCSPDDVLRGFSVAKIAQRVSMFSTKLAEKLINCYLNDSDTIFDPFSGFSGRMLGAFNCGKQYFGYDINEDHIKESNEIIDYKHIDDRCSVEVKDIIKTEPCDFTYLKDTALFTCPPYGGKEHWNIYKDEVEMCCDEWIDLCIKKYKVDKYLFVVDKTEKYKDYIVETLEKKSHFGNVKEYVVFIKKLKN